MKFTYTITAVLVTHCVSQDCTGFRLIAQMFLYLSSNFPWWGTSVDAEMKGLSVDDRPTVANGVLSYFRLGAGQGRIASRVLSAVRSSAFDFIL